LSKPFDIYRPKEFDDVKTKDGKKLDGVQVMSVDILPTAIPLDASRHFSDKLAPYLDALIDLYSASSSSTETEANKELEEALQRSTIAQGGVLQEKHTWLKRKVDAWRQTQPQMSDSDAVWEGQTATPPASVTDGARKKRVLMLGSGMVAGPAVEKIASRKDVHLVIG
jgi:alpha-aminoadipic semialdehyde synthase